MKVQSHDDCNTQFNIVDVFCIPFIYLSLLLSVYRCNCIAGIHLCVCIVAIQWQVLFQLSSETATSLFIQVKYLLRALF